MIRTLQFIAVAGMAALALAPAAFAEQPARTSASTPIKPSYVLPDRRGLSDFALTPRTIGTVTSVAATPAGIDVARRLGTTLAPPRPAANTALVTPAADSVSGLEWSQIGIGFALGIVLALGLSVALTVTRARRVAH